jgi:hypothetical protein
MGDESNRDNQPDLYTLAIAMWRFRRMELKDAFQAAETTKVEQALRVEKFREELQKVVGKRDDIDFRINGGCVEAEIEDLRFASLEFPASGKEEPLTVVTLLGRCPSCGVEGMSEPIHGLSEVGKILEKFEPIRWHYCYR